jgi:hypothetical protein
VSGTGDRLGERKAEWEDEKNDLENNEDEQDLVSRLAHKNPSEEIKPKVAHQISAALWSEFRSGGDGLVDF